MRCLIIDDDTSVLELAESAALEANFQVRAESTARNIDAVEISSFDLILLDLMMPEVDGIEFLRIIETAKPMPEILLMSGLGTRALASARQLGLTKGLRVTEIIKKPFKRAELVEVLRRLSASNRSKAPRIAQGANVPPLTKADLLNALQRNEILIHMQPQISIKTGAWVGIEALARWQHPQHGLLYPNAFISIAEKEDMAVRFTEHILDLSLEALNRLSSDIGFDGTISVNIPPSALGDVSLTNRLISTVASKGVLNSRVMVEITETSVPKDISTGMDIEMRLRVHGFQLSIDDFGTGFSSLERLRSSPFDELKIDLVFVRDALRDPSAKSIVENSIQLGHSLEMKVVAEGVENAETLALLSELGCDIAQGYYISKPISMEDLCKWSSTRALHRVA